MEIERIKLAVNSDLCLTGLKNAFDQFKEEFGKYDKNMYVEVCIEDIFIGIELMNKIIWNYPKFYCSCNRYLPKYAWCLWGIIDGKRCEIYSEGS